MDRFFPEEALAGKKKKIETLSIDQPLYLNLIISFFHLLGDIVGIAGFANATVTSTLADPTITSAIPVSTNIYNNNITPFYLFDVVVSKYYVISNSILNSLPISLPFGFVCISLVYSY